MILSDDWILELLLVGFGLVVLVQGNRLVPAAQSDFEPANVPRPTAANVSRTRADVPRPVTASAVRSVSTRTATANAGAVWIRRTVVWSAILRSAGVRTASDINALRLPELFRRHCAMTCLDFTKWYFCSPLLCIRLVLI